MKKILIPICLALSAIGAGSLMSAKTVTDQDAIDDVAINKTIATATTDLVPGDDNPAIIDGEATTGNNFLKLATKYNVSGKTVEITWKYDDPNHVVYARRAWDETHDMIEFNFPKRPEPGQTAEPGSFEIKVDTFKCGNTVVSGDEYDQFYKIALQPEKLYYDYQPLDFFVKLNDEKTCYNMIEQKAEGTFLKRYREDQEGQSYYYTYTYGKVLYMSPDFNWGIIADGNSFMQLYFGSADATRANNFSALKAGNYVRVRGSVGKGYGNFQFSFINEARLCTDEEKAKITEPAESIDMTSDFIKSIVNENGCGIYAQDHLMNRNVKATGKFVPGSLKDSEGKATSKVNPKSRFTFKFKVGDQELLVSYDYHVQYNDIGTETGKFLEKVVNNPNSEFTIDGVLRYNLRNKDEDLAHAVENLGDWTLVPYSTNGNVGPSSGGLPMGALIGICVGGVVAVAGIGVGVFFLLKKKKHAA